MLYFFSVVDFVYLILFISSKELILWGDLLSSVLLVDFFLLPRFFGSMVSVLASLIDFISSFAIGSFSIGVPLSLGDNALNNKIPPIMTIRLISPIRSLRVMENMSFSHFFISA